MVTVVAGDEVGKFAGFDVVMRVEGEVRGGSRESGSYLGRHGIW